MKKRKDVLAFVDKPVPVKLNDEALLAKSRELSKKLTQRKALRHDLNVATRRIKADVAELDAGIEVLRQQLEEGFELLPQGSLFAQDLPDPTLPKDQAAQALGKIAEAAGEGKPLPTEPHEYQGVAAEVDRCSVCDAPEGDPVHHGGDLLPHVFSPGTAKDGNESVDCVFQGCGRVEGDPLHDIHGGARPEPVAAPAAEDAPPVRPCPACARGTCEVHAHAFEGEELLCTRCKKAKRAKIHRVEVEDPAPAAAAAPPNGTGDLHDFDETEPAPKIDAGASAEVQS